jgi:outer membrane biosynthesis protein TonB
MKKPFAISIGFHAAILLAALVVLPTPKPFEVKPPESIQVDISTISDKTQKMALSKDPSPPTPTPAAKETKVVKDVPPAPKVADEVKTAAHEPKQPPPEPEKKLEPPKPKPPEPTPLDSDPLKQMIADDQQKLADLQKAEEKKKLAEEKKIEDKKKADEKKKVDEKKKLEAKKKQDQLMAENQALLNKIAGESTAPAKPTEKKGSPKQAAKDQQGSDQADTATLTAALVSKVKQCFNVPPAAREANISVPIHFMLNQDGSVIGVPEVASGGGDPVFDATARAAISAIVECQNYDLPADQYDQWKDNVLDFNPTQLSGT